MVVVYLAVTSTSTKYNKFKIMSIPNAKTI